MLSILITLLVVGIILWAINSFVPMDEKIKKILNVIIVILVIIWLLKALGIMHYLQNIFFNHSVFYPMIVGRLLRAIRRGQEVALS